MKTNPYKKLTYKSEDAKTRPTFFILAIMKSDTYSHVWAGPSKIWKKM